MRAVDVRQSLRLVLALLVAAGLAIAPLATPAAAGHSKSSGPMAAGMMHMSGTADMPCCPHEQKSKSCQDCPLVAICMLKVLQAGRLASAVLIRAPSYQRLHLFDDVIVDGQARPPPDHPPRTLV